MRPQGRVYKKEIKIENRTDESKTGIEPYSINNQFPTRIRRKSVNLKIGNGNLYTYRTSTESIKSLKCIKEQGIGGGVSR